MDDPNYDPNYITRDKCDSCGRHGVGAMFHHYGTPVMFLCTSPLCCATTVIERLARRDIDAWLQPSSNSGRQSSGWNSHSSTTVRGSLTGTEVQ